MKIMVFNDTSDFHDGCRAVMDYLHNDLKENGHIILESVKNGEFPQYSEKNFKDAEAIVINGEGTMHHDRPLAKWYLELISKAYSLEKKIFLINTVWQQMTLSKELKKILQESYVSVRDIKSQSELNKHNINAHLHLDLSYNMKPTGLYPGWDESFFNHLTRDGVVIGSFSHDYDLRRKNIPSVNIFKDKWEDVISRLSTAEYFITSRHHEMYAACIARCPFYVFRGNSWKNEGFLDTAACHLAIGPQMPFPYDQEDRTVFEFMKGWYDARTFSEHVEEIKKARPYYDQLFDWMDAQTPFSFSTIDN
tara:strand:- start:91 stop:1011 length:921 start_codon:yes stop_codon:yes gene_type:complete